jgi:hypothetical protein
MDYSNSSTDLEEFEFPANPGGSLQLRGFCLWDLSARHLPSRGDGYYADGFPYGYGNGNGYGNGFERCFYVGGTLLESSNYVYENECGKGFVYGFGDGYGSGIGSVAGKGDGAGGGYRNGYGYEEGYLYKDGYVRVL